MFLSLSSLCLCALCFYFLLFCQQKGNALTRKDYEGQDYNTWDFFLKTEFSRMNVFDSWGSWSQTQINIATTTLQSASENRVLMIWQDPYLFGGISRVSDSLGGEGGDEILQMTIVFHGTHGVWVWSQLKPWKWMSRFRECVPILDFLLLGRVILTLWRMARELIITSSTHCFCYWERVAFSSSSKSFTSYMSSVWA